MEDNNAVGKIVVLPEREKSRPYRMKTEAGGIDTFNAERARARAKRFRH